MGSEIRDKLQELVLQYLEKLSYESGSSSSLNLPDFDYYASDFLEFAELNLNAYTAAIDSREKENELMSCVANLKRALECQIDCFLHVWGLSTAVGKKNLGLDVKLRFLTEAGIFTSRTIQRFTVIRNRIEHDYKKPLISDLEALFDLVTAFVSILHNVMVLRSNDNIGFQILDNDERIGFFHIGFNEPKPTFKAEWEIYKPVLDKGQLAVTLDDPTNFAYFFRIWYILASLDAYGSWEHAYAKIKA